MTLFRFAPSPTGYLHVGNARIALLNYLYAKKLGGKFMLRLDDTDDERNEKRYEEGIYEDLSWLGLEWDCFERQSDRMNRYAIARQRLYENGRLYPCFETAEELGLKRKTQLSRGLPPVYDRAALKLSPDEAKSRIESGEKHHWRFHLSDRSISFHDEVRGDANFEPGHLSDPVLIREDGRILYTLSSVVDDGELNISHVVRGEDHITNTAIQIELFEALGYDLPKFAHLPLMVGADGGKLSKRIGGLALRELHEQDIEPAPILAHLAALGTNEAARGDESMAELIDKFKINGFGRATPRFDVNDLTHLNHNALAATSFDSIKGRLCSLIGYEVSEAFWKLIRGNLDHFGDVINWAIICYGEIPNPELSDEDREYLKLALETLPDPQQWDGKGFYDEWVASLKAITGRKGKALFMPLRLALTGGKSGPQMPDLMALMGHEICEKRLSFASKNH